MLLHVAAVNSGVEYIMHHMDCSHWSRTSIHDELGQRCSYPVYLSSNLPPFVGSIPLLLLSILLASDNVHGFSDSIWGCAKKCDAKSIYPCQTSFWRYTVISVNKRAAELCQGNVHAHRKVPRCAFNEELCRFPLQKQSDSLPCYGNKARCKIVR